MLAEPLAITLLVIEAFERLDVPYLIGGSLASALHGTAWAMKSPTGSGGIFWVY